MSSNSSLVVWLRGGCSEEKILLRFLAAGVLINTMAIGMITPLLPAFASRFSLSQSFITALLTLRGLSTILCSAIASFLVPILGYRTMMIATLIVTIVSSIILATMPSWHLLAMALMLQGACDEAIWVSGLSLSAKMYGRVGSDPSPVMAEDDPISEPLIGSSTESSGMVGAVGMLLSVASIGYLAGPFVGSVIYQYTMPWMPFTVVAVLCLLVLLAFLMLTLPIAEQPMSVARLKDSAAMDLSPPDRASKFSTLAGNRLVAAMLSTVLLTSASFGAQEVMLPFHLTTSCQLTVSQVGIAFATGAVSYGITASLAEEIVKSIGPMACIRIGVIGQAIMSPFIFLPSFSCHMLYQLCFAAAVGASLALNGTPLFPCIIEELDKLNYGNYAVVISLYNSFYTVGISVGPLVAAALLNSFSPLLLMSALNSLVLLCVPLLYWAEPLSQ